jgi:hypothetical protein
MFSHAEDGVAEMNQQILELRVLRPYGYEVEPPLEMPLMSWLLAESVLALVDGVQSLLLIPWGCCTEEERLERP